MSKIGTTLRLAKIALTDHGFYKRTFDYIRRRGLRELPERLRNEVRSAELFSFKTRQEPGSVKGRLKYSIVMPVYNVSVKWIDIAISSVKAQTYANWELCIADDASTDTDLLDYLQSIEDPRIKIVFSDNNQGISDTTNNAASLATGDYIVLLDNDDVLDHTALDELNYAVVNSNADILYSDNEVIDEKGERLAVLHKPDWSPDLFLSQMYIGHLLAFKRTLFEDVGGFDASFDGSQDYDLVLRMLERTDSIAHIDRVLYSWRSLPTSTSTNAEAKPYAQSAGQRALQRYVQEVYKDQAPVIEETDNLFVYDARWPIPEEELLASLIIPTKDHAVDLLNAVTSIEEATDYRNFEILIMNNRTTEEETLELLHELPSIYGNIRVIDADYEFNWSRINNQGIKDAKGDVFVFLNNDIEILDPEWLTRLVENAIRPEIGMVGGLLLYPDGTIQHAGVVMGIGGWADHVYRGMSPIHHGDPYISPMVSRNVSAVTGACMAFDRSVYERVGGFDEDFIVCGSDVEICLRAMKCGYRNLYEPGVKLIHHESKTRDPKDVPENDFEMSRRHYRELLESGDPYYNKNLRLDTTTPAIVDVVQQADNLIHDIKHVSIPEIRELNLALTSSDTNRINLVIPTVNKIDTFGGISTALKLFLDLVESTGYKSRVIVLDEYPQDPVDLLDAYTVQRIGHVTVDDKVIIAAGLRGVEEIQFTESDWFLCTFWSTAYCVQQSLSELRAVGAIKYDIPLLYLIQDFEPGFYPWSTNYMLADATYKDEHPIVGIFNSSYLADFFDFRGYEFHKKIVFEPVLNKSLKAQLINSGKTIAKKKQILVYGRPSVDRNAFQLLVESLKMFIRNYPRSNEWEFLSAGEHHDVFELTDGRYLSSLGKLSLEEYASTLRDSYAGISLMVSPHPSYPPLEMAAFGVQVVTNGFKCKSLEDFSCNIHQVKSVSPLDISNELIKICESYTGEGNTGEVPEYYLRDGEMEKLINDLKEMMAKDFR